jgi:hypothetical protein
MTDLLMLGAILVFFILSWGYALGIEKL